VRAAHAAPPCPTTPAPPSTRVPTSPTRPAELVSRTHCTLRCAPARPGSASQRSADEGVLLTDDSANGTYINGVGLGKGKTMRIQAGTRITFSHKSELPRAYVESLQPLVWKAYSGGIKDLDFANKRIGVVSAIVIGKCLELNGSLTSLNLNGNDVGHRGGAAIGEALRKNTALTSLDLGANKLGAEGAAAVAKHLKVNKGPLATLDLSWNAIGARGAAAIGDALQANETLTSLQLFSNEIDAEGAAALADGFKVNTKLAELNLSDNSLGDDGGAAIGAESLEVNQSLTLLDLRYKCVPPPIALSGAQHRIRTASCRVCVPL